ncbi:MAG TPA: hypothetical protein VFP65_01260 [Anaeromyxobacteraceae bacterium]|nr:hypothetical protein [Anaeromyxobacteraceae bacterium]
MRLRLRRPAIAIACAASAGVAAAAAALRPVTVIELSNAERGRALAVALAPGEPFSVTSQHSMYDQPVTEEFVVRADGAIALRAVSSPSAAVREYLGITSGGEVHAMERVLPEIVFRVAMGAPQRLRVAGVERSFLELGERGDRVVLRAVRRPAALAPAGGGR